MTDDPGKDPQQAKKQTGSSESAQEPSGQKSTDPNVAISDREKENNKWRDRFNRLLKPKTWSTSIVLIILVWVGGSIAHRGFETGFNWLDLIIDAHFKSLGMSVEHLNPMAVTANDLNLFAQTNGFQEFKLNLDDRRLTNYVIVPFRIRSITRHPIERVCLNFQLEGARLVDVQYVVRVPKGKNVTIMHSLPDLKWQWPTNLTYVQWSPLKTFEFDVDIYGSIARDRGFGSPLFLSS